VERTNEHTARRWANFSVFSLKLDVEGRLRRIGNTPRDLIAKLADDHAKAGARLVPLVDFNTDNDIPSDADCANVGTWATIRNVEAIEFGNEPWTQPSWNYSLYARAFKITQDAVYAANPSMTLIAVADPGDDPAGPRHGLLVMQEMQKLGVKPRAIQFHVYGEKYIAAKLARCKKDLEEMGWSDIPIWVTETGIPSNGRVAMLPNTGPYPTRVPHDMAAKFIENATETLRLGGVSRVLLFKGIDNSPPGWPFQDAQRYYGLTNNEGKQKGVLTTKAIELFAKYRG
jgi:hypothetical protein